MVTDSPGCTCTLRTTGRNFQVIPGPLLARNWTVTVRFSSTCWVALASYRPPVLPLMPVISQNTSYNGTSANPKANMPTTPDRHQPITLALLLRSGVFSPVCSDMVQPPGYFTSGGVENVW